MKKPLFYLTLSVLILGAAGSALAAGEVSLEGLVISANKIGTPEGQSTATVHVVQGKDLEALGKHSLEEAIADIPGVYSVTPGGPAFLNRTLIRGAKNRFTQIRFNDFPLRDPTSPQGDMSALQNSLMLPPESLERVEALKGAQSTLYGSNAVGGVISLFPAQSWNTPPQADLRGAYGSFATVEGAARMAWGDDRHYLNFTPMYVNSDGFKDIDHSNKSFILGAGTRLSRQDSMEVNVYRMDSRYANYDSPNWDSVTNAVSPQKVVQDPGNHTEGDYTLVGLTYEAPPHDLLYSRLKLAYSAANRARFDRGMFGDSVGTYSGDTYYVETLNGITPLPWLTFLLGGDYEGQDIDFSTDDYMGGKSFTDDYFNSGSFFAKAVLSLLDKRLNLDLGGRYNLYDHFAGAFIYNAGAAYNFDFGLRLYANTGTGYRAPSAYEMYGDLFGNKVGNPDLDPEKSVSYEAGLEQSLWNKRLTLGAAVFRNDFKNMIDTSGYPSLYYNLHKARTRGGELYASLQPVKQITLRLAYTRTKAEEKADTAVEWTESRNFPKNTLHGSIIARPVPGLTLAASGRWQDKARVQVFDNITYMSTVLEEKAFFTLDLAAHYDLSENFGIFCKVNNLLNKEYTLDYHAMPKINGSAGMKVSF
ncbi:MAG: TonB-dependent receptor [Deltaproteobacteria bacterium]|nr:TonB-dependent receptor [Deltaproteobacteria bacterium]